MIVHKVALPLSCAHKQLNEVSLSPSLYEIEGEEQEEEPTGTKHIPCRPRSETLSVPCQVKLLLDQQMNEGEISSLNE